MDKVTELLISNLIGLFIGLGTSFFSWWVLYHKIVPEVKFADFISKIPKKTLPGCRYRIKFKNVGKRAILDVHVIARLVVDWSGSEVWTAYYVRLSVTGDKRCEMPTHR